tara:strand:+ start:987 stop:1364 length:378 start_codon:yes stop_codon:yes gene_type:complete
MGMDVYAVSPNPDVENSDYFRNNVWWWRPLWDFVANNCSDILSEEDIRAGQFNEGHHINANKAVAIATRLLQMIENGHVDNYVKEYKAEIEKLDDDNWDKNYPINSENIKTFANFCLHSGGFKIH